jgi:paraquat-inducible protein A
MNPSFELLGCDCCGQVVRTAHAAVRCPRCRHPIYRIKPGALQRTWAYLLAAAVLYVPANVLPVMSTTSGFKGSTHTLMGGIVELWHDGAFALSIIVFAASIAVPLMKIGALALLAYTAQFKPNWRRLERTRVFGLIEAVGHWSMLDVYVVLLLAGMVRFGSVASAAAGTGLLAFAAVVVLTMLATASFDARLIWRDPIKPQT